MSFKYSNAINHPIWLKLKGAKVIIACKDMKRCEETKNDIINKTFNKKVECAKCDLASLQSIKEFVDKINESIILKLVYHNYIKQLIF